MFPHLSPLRMLFPCVTEGNLKVNDNLESVGEGEGRTNPQQNSDGLKIGMSTLLLGFLSSVLRQPGL